MAKVLLVEDDEKLSSMLAGWFKSNSYVVDVAGTGADASVFMETYLYDLIVLDVALPDDDGTRLCREYRKSGGNARVLMLTGLQSVQDKEVGFDAGADDYMTKPFDVRELSVRLKALMRRGPALVPDVLQIGDLSLDPRSRVVKSASIKLDLAPREFALLEFFMRNPNRVFTGEAILDRVWSSNSECSIHSVRTYINRLRNILKTDGNLPMIQTEYGIGYKLVLPAGDST